MKRIVLASCFVIAFSDMIAQVKPDTTTRPVSVSSGNINTVPAAYDTAMKVSFVRTWDVSRPISVDTSVTSTSRTVQEVKQTTAYVDGIGRPLQIVVKQITPSGNDLVTPFVYDSLGKETFKYLPYSQIDSITNTGKFKRDPFNNQKSFYSNTTYNPGLLGEQVYYNKTLFEASPLNRVDSFFSVGNSWGGSHVGTSNSYLVNVAADSVRIWNIGISIGSTPTSNGYYSPATLYKTLSTDEHGKQIIEYEDKDGNTVLKKVQIDASPSSHHTGWLCTYYVYDDLNNLRFVIQPLGTDSLKSHGWQFENSTWSGSTIAKELCFSYEYDERNRMIIKRVPGAGEVWMVYDARNRVVMIQDSILRLQGNWLYTQYDAINRTSVTGVWTNSNDRSYHQAQAGGSITYPNPSSNYSVLTQNYYDNYNWVSGSGSGLSTTFISTYASNTNYFYIESNSTFPYPRSISPSYTTNGMVTGTKTKVLGTSSYLYAVSFYDERARVIQVHSINYSGGKDTLTNQYDFSDRILRSLLCHEKSGTNAQKYLVFTKTDYDAMGRLTKLSKKIGNSPETVIEENTYDELGQLQKKNFGRKRDGTNQNTYATAVIDSLQYTYNVRGWLSGINKNYARGTGSDNYFGMELDYDFGFTQTLKNGNIAGVRWKSKGAGEIRAYGFSYDNASRITRADFTQDSSDIWDTRSGIDYTIKDMGYDDNGNIIAMTQKGLKLATSSVIDSLVYGYNPTSNRLNYVSDKTNDTTTLLGDFKEYANNTTQDYSYDGNGNLVTDNNKKISSIHYNHLNLPDTIKVNGKGIISYIYDALGSKLSKTTVDSTGSPINTTTTVYLSGFEYKNDTLQQIQQEEGRIRPKRANYSDTMYYDYFLKDNLGNIRTVLTDQLQTDMYPAATMEFADSTIEQAFYSNLPETRVNRPSGYPNDTSYSNPNDKVAKVSAATGNHIVGPGIVLKVMAGDSINIHVNSWWNSNDTPGSPVSPLGDIISLLANGISGIANGHPSSSELINNNILSPGISDFLNSQGWSGLRPKATLSWVLLDEQFKYVSSSSGYVSCNRKNFEQTFQQVYPITKNGYFYVYVSNETPNIDVFYDNLQVTHIRGPLVSEDHYYPFGERMFGICSNALNFGDGGSQKKKYNGIEKENDLSLEMYDAQLRDLDGQTGRWWQIDPKIENMEMWSPYASNYDNPITYSDPLGDEGEGCCKELLRVVDIVLTSASGVLNGTLNTVTLGVWPTDPFNFRNRVDDELKQVYDNGIFVGQIGPLLMPNPKPVKEGPVLSPAGGKSNYLEPPKTNSSETPVENTKQSSSNSSTGQGSEKGRGQNNRKPDPKATGDHSVIDKNGNTTYKKNDKNPTGYDEVKRTDVKGKAHTNTDGSKVETPHVHEKGKKNVRPAVKGKDY